jgi:hypothetical protein
MLRLVNLVQKQKQSKKIVGWSDKSSITKNEIDFVLPYDDLSPVRFKFSLA